jgi:hypothetical protein
MERYILGRYSYFYKLLVAYRNLRKERLSFERCAVKTRFFMRRFCRLDPPIIGCKLSLWQDPISAEVCQSILEVRLLSLYLFTEAF